MKSKRFSKLRVENLEERTLLTVMAGGFEQTAELVAPTEATTWVVNTIADPSRWSKTDNVISLREAIGRASAGDTITFDLSMAGGTITLSGTELSIDKGITIDASDIGGITIDTDGTIRVFHIKWTVETSSVELISLTITGGKELYGGGIYNENTLSMTNCTVSGNFASDPNYSSFGPHGGYGGGIYNEHGTLTMTNCTVSGNNASSPYGSYGGGIYNDDGGRLTMTGCTISGNTASTDSYGGTSNSPSGGGIYSQGILTMTACTVLGNTSSFDGGGILNNGTLTMTNCIVSRNIAGSGGGGILNNGTLTMTNCTMAGNTTDYGGGIYNTGTLTMKNCTVSGNIANYRGGGIYNRGASKIYNTIIAQNIAGNSGNDVFFSSASLYAYNTLSSFTDWTDSESCHIYDASKPLFHVGNGFYLLAANSQAINKGNNSYISGYETDISGNLRIVGDTVDIGAYEYQEGIDLETPSTVVITNLDVVDPFDNLVSLREAIFYAAAGDTVTFDSILARQTITLSGIELKIDKRITIDASAIGGITIDADGKSRIFRINGETEDDSVELIDLTITGGAGEADGGGVYNSGTLTITNCTISGNTVSASTFNYFSTSSGGGIYNSGTLTMTNSSISGNIAFSGGGISSGGTLTMTNCTVSGNTASDRGGISSYSGILTLTNTIVSQNYANNIMDVYSSNSFSSSYNIIGLDPGFVVAPIFEDGKLVNADELNLSLRPKSIAIDRGLNDFIKIKTDIAGNLRVVAAWSETPTVDIGAYEYQGTVEHRELKSTVVTTNLDIFDVTDGLISLREAVFYAGPSETVTFDKSLAGEITELNGSQLEIYSGITIDASSVGGIVIDANEQSRVFYVGGGDESDSVELIGLTIIGGRTKYGGGGIFNDFRSTLTMMDCTVLGNIGNYYNGRSGGGISNDGILTMMNCTVLENYVSTSISHGGGIYNSGTLTMTDCIVLENAVTSSEAFGGGIYNDRGGILTMMNCTVSGNSASTTFSTSSGGGIYNSGTLTMTNCTVTGNYAITYSTTSSSPNYYGGGICNKSGTSYLYNTIVIQNTVIQKNNLFENDVYRNASSPLYAYNVLSSFTDWTESENCIVYDPDKPLFKDAANGDYTLVENSQAIDKGNNSYVETDTDLAGNKRIVNGIVDLGAYEFQGDILAEQLATPTILTGNNGVYASFGANRHQITWDAIENASGYELTYTSENRDGWTSVITTETSAVITGLTYGDGVSYRVRALGEGSYTDSEWSEGKSFTVCPMDINNDGDIGGIDRNILAVSWFAEEGDNDYIPAADIDGNGDVGGIDRAFLANNWLNEVGIDDMVYPRPLAADTVFAEFASADLAVDLDVF